MSRRAVAQNPTVLVTIRRMCLIQDLAVIGVLEWMYTLMAAAQCGCATALEICKETANVGAVTALIGLMCLVV